MGELFKGLTGVAVRPLMIRVVLRRCLTLPHTLVCSTISAVRLSFRVRNGAGRFPDAITTAKNFGGHTVCAQCCLACCVVCVDASSDEVRSCCDRFVVCVTWFTSTKVCVSDRCISTSQLHTLLCFHVWPINPIVCRAPHGNLILKQASRLDAFSGYPSRT